MTARQVVVLGDVAVDIVVEAEAIAVDDDRDAPIGLHLGGQAANVARWASSLGSRPILLTQQLGDDLAGVLAGEALARDGVTVVPAFDAARVPVVCSFVAAGRRTLLSDDGGVDYLPRAPWDQLVSVPAGWLHVSGYALARSSNPGALTSLLKAAADDGWQVTLDLSAVSVVERLGGEEVVDLLQRIPAAAVFANDAEWAAVGPGREHVDAARIIKHGAAGCTFEPRRGSGGRRLDLPSVASTVLDPTGAGDALAAGWLVGGPRLAMAAAARCVAVRGAVPHDRSTSEKRGTE